MSGPARRGSRAATRSALASPYARPGSKKSSWSIAGFLSYLNPLRSWGQSQELPSYQLADNDDVKRAAAAESLSSRGQQISKSLNGKNHRSSSPIESAEGPPPSTASSSTSPTNATFSHDVSPESPQKGLEYLSKYLVERPKGAPLSAGESEELISIIKQSTPAEEHENFRFSTSPSTPVRGNSPLFPSTGTNSVPFSFSPSYVNPPSTPDSSPRKLLKENPNGTYRWKGGGSARPARNRFHSPAFGPSPRRTRLAMRGSPEKAAEPIKTDTKRRRVGEGASASSSPSGTSMPVRSPAPAPSPTRAAQAAHLPLASPSPLPSSKSTPNELKAPQKNGLRPSTSNLRAPPKPTAPAVPSPLRQAWGQSSSPTSSSRSSDDGLSTTQRVTKAASYMSELIKEVTPVKNLDVSNPYQAASPVKIVGIRPKPKPARRTRASGKPSVPPESLTNGKAPGEKDDCAKEKEMEMDKDVEERYSAQAIIEATLPKGSKRSRAPVNIGKGLPSSARSPSPPKPAPKPKSKFAPQIEEVEDEDEEERLRLSKKSKGIRLESTASINELHRKAFSSGPIIEEIDDEMTDGQAAAKPSEVIEVATGNGINGISKVPFSPPASTPVFPTSSSTRSPLLNPSSSGPKVSAIPKEPSKLRFSYKPEPTAPSDFSPTASSDTTPPLFSIGGEKSSGLNTATPSAPSAFSFGATSVPAAAAATPFATSSFTPAPSDTAATKRKAANDPKEYVGSLPVTSLPVFSFDDDQPLASGSGLSLRNNKAKAAVKEMSQSKLPQFDFNAPISLASTSTTASASTTVPVPEPPKAFNWTAAGLKPPDNSSEWECKTCLVRNKDSLATTCPACGTERPVPSKAPAKSFDWDAAGMKKPESGNAGEWTCSLCMLKNPASAVSKCNQCTEPRPGASSSSTSPIAPTPPSAASPPVEKPVVQSFDWAAAGLKPPQPKVGVWRCGLCGVENSEKATKCMACDTAR
ncbi:hypothetical protein GYMLUDRAFT_260710 [Collybiopsis luxurians FD-317 M1]|uniref:RanBP2-type domain-containing protein n=1 Tax=Collybiopsis luxurians FD-317 M1 TaxID=944289 RepID=A0A0D0C0D7_9AGAR|nr:hypothetical protein GYMLUDRAFT_260710 [Collybiopsis luxurians FD-317 M1]